MPFDVSDHESYAKPHGAVVATLLADAIAGVNALHVAGIGAPNDDGL
ncbi:hypothetical protein ACFCYB_30160 [Streptomyces sp. NPDC056309]